MREAIKKAGAYPTHEGAEKAYTELADGLDRYAAAVKELYNPIWEQECQWGGKWETLLDFPKERIEAKRKEYLAKG